MIVNKNLLSLTMNPQSLANPSNRPLLNGARRELLWNVSEPGDPYDIRRSMIAKMPGDKKIFMGNHLELICLLQAAEIERLCQFLEDYKLRFRQIERSNLDRHSYEIQIKQLTQRLADEETSKGENSKLVEFVKRQQAEIQYLQRNYRDSNSSTEGLRQTYERSLQLTNQLSLENKELKDRLQQFRKQYMSLNGRYQALEKGKNRQIQELKLSFAQSSRQSYESTINSIRMQYQSDLRKSEYEFKRLKQLNQAKNAEINDLLKQRDELIASLNSNAGQRNNELHRQIYQYQNKFVLFGQEIERLNIALRDYTSKLQEAQIRNKDLNRAAERNDYERREIETRLRSSMGEVTRLNQLIKRYEGQLKKIDTQQISLRYQQQITQITTKLKYQADLSRTYKQEIDRLSYQNSKYKVLEKENADLRLQANQINIYRNKIAEAENRVALLSQQLQRLKYILQEKDAAYNRSAISQNQAFKSKLKQVQNNISSKYESEISRVKVQYQQKIEMVTLAKGSEIQTKSRFYQSQFQRIREQLNIKNQESQKQRARIYELQSAFSRNEAQINAKFRNYQYNITNLKKELQEMFQKNKILADSERKTFELTSRLTQYQRQIQHLGQNLKLKDEEILALKSRLRQTEGTTQRYEIDISRKVAVYEQTVTSIRSENDELRKRLNQLIGESNKKILEASNQIQRLGNNIRQLTQQNEYLKQNIQRISTQRDEILRRLQEVEGKSNAVNSQYRLLGQQNENLKRQIGEYKATISRFEGEMSRLSANMELTLTNTGRQSENMKTKISTYESKLNLLSQEFQRLNLLLRNKSEEYFQLQSKFKNQTIQFQTLKKKFAQYEAGVRTKFEVEVTQKYNSYEQSLQQSRNQAEELRRRFTELQYRYKQSYQDYSAQLQSLRVKLSQRETGQVEYTRKISVYESNVVNLTRINQQLQKKLAQLDSILRQRTEEYNRIEVMLKNASNENENLKKQFKQTEYLLTQKYQAEINRRQNIYEQNLAKIAAQNQQFKRKLQQIGGDASKRLSEFQFKYKQLTQENQTLKRKLESYETSMGNYENEVKRRFQANDQKIANLAKENEELRRKLLQVGELGRKMAEYQNKISNLMQQIERLQAVLKNLHQQNENLKKQIYQKQSSRNQYEQEVSKVITVYQQNTLVIQKENEQYKRKMGQYEQRLIAMSQELERVNAAFRNKNEENIKLDQTVKSVFSEAQLNRKKAYELQTLISTKYEVQFSRKLGNYEQNMVQLSQQNQELNRRLKQSESWGRKCSQLQNRIVITNQQLERLTQSLKSKQEQLNKLDQICRSQGFDLQNQKRRYADLEANYARNYEFQVTKLNRGYQQNITALRKGMADYESKLLGTTQEIQRLNNVLRLKVEESVQLNSRINSLNLQLQDNRRRLRQNESVSSQNVVILKKENEQLVRRLHQLQLNLRQNDQSNERKVAAYDNKAKGLSQQNERLAQLLKTRTDELEQTRRQFREYQQSVSIQIKGNYGQYQSKITEFRRQNQELKRNIAQLRAKVNQYENKLVMASQEMQRLSFMLKSKTQQLAKAEGNLQGLSRENQNLRMRLQQSSQFSRRVSEYEIKIAQIIQENEKLQTVLRNKTEDLANVDGKSRQLQLDNESVKKQLREYEFQFGRKISAYEQTIAQLKRDNQQLIRKRTEYETKIAMLSQQLQRVSSQLRIKSQEALKISQEFDAYRRSKQTQFEGQYAVLKQNYTMIVGEYETAKKHLMEYEQSLIKLSAEFERLHGIINHVNGEKQSLMEKNRILSEEIMRLNIENSSLDQQTRDIRLRLTDETALQKRISEHLGLMVLLFAEIQTLRMRVKAKEQEVVEVRKSSLAPHII